MSSEVTVRGSRTSVLVLAPSACLALLEREDDVNSSFAVLADGGPWPSTAIDLA